MNLWRALMGETRSAFGAGSSFIPPPGTDFPLNMVASVASPSSDHEGPDSTFQSYVRNAYKVSGVVSATIYARMMLFSEARFQWQQILSGRPGDLFGTPGLAPLERPWPNGTTGEMLSRAEQDVSLGGNFYLANEGARLRRLRPDWVSIVLTAPPAVAVQSDVAGYAYRPGGQQGKSATKFYLPEEVAHWSPLPDPEEQYRGMSWLTPVMTDILADLGATNHKRQFFRNAATPNLAVSFADTVTLEQFKAFKAQMDASHNGSVNAYKTLYLGGGADVKVLGADMRQLEFAVTQGHGETRITAAGGVPAVIVGLSEGLQAATYSNFGQARRKFGDHWARPQWRSICAALEPLLRPPPNSAPGTYRLWYDDRDIAFLREDKQDAATIQSTEASSIRTLVDAGYIPETVRAAVLAQDWTLLKHSGLFSVQLQPPGTQAPTPAPTAPPGGTP